ncbi:MAG: pilus assembly protein [Bacilli bacterium]|nr:pilus assembly protein [Bacilli bacterium]
MDKKGQTLVVFVLLIPLFMILAALIIDNSMIVNEKLHLKNVTKDIIRNDLIKTQIDNDKIKMLLKKNNIPTDELEIIREKGKLNIKNHYFINSIFGKVVGFNNYELEIDITGEIKNNKVIFK